MNAKESENRVRELIKSVILEMESLRFMAERGDKSAKQALAIANRLLKRAIG